MELRDLQQRMRFLQEQLAPVTRQREYQEKEIQRLNKVGAPLLLPSSLPRQELVSDDAHISLGSQEKGMGWVCSPSCSVISASHAGHVPMALWRCRGHSTLL